MRILYAEDEKAINDAVSEILRKNKYSVDSVYDGEEALDYIAAIEYDIIILDSMMPKKDGMSVLKEIRQMKYKTPVLVLTAKSSIDDKIEGLDLGADDYMTKPFEVEELLARLRAISRRTNEIYDDSISMANIKLSRSHFSLSSEDYIGQVSLSNKEYQILELLMSNTNMYFTTEMIMDKIWGYDIDTDISVIWVNISNLRKKLNLLNSKVKIKSKRNIGYYLEIQDA